MSVRSIARKVLPAPAKALALSVINRAKLANQAIGSHRPMTSHLINRYCTGRGVEIGPGTRPYGPPGTLLIDRFPVFAGRQAVAIDALADANALPLATDSLDYLISSHCLEHQPDTLTTLDEWRRVLRTDGFIFLVLPHAERTFDRGRPLHRFEHHDAERGRTVDPEVDDHFVDWESVLNRTSHPWTPGARRADGTWDRRWMAERALIHYHAWTQHEMVEIMQRTGWRIHTVIEELPDRTDSFVVVARPGQ